MRTTVILLVAFGLSATLAAADRPKPAATVKPVPAHNSQTLPPHWARRLKVGQKIDPALYAHAKPVDAALLKLLPVAPIGTIDVQIEDKIVRLYSTTLVVVRVLPRPKS